MSDTTASPGGADAIETIPFTPPTPADNTSTSLSEAAKQLADYRWKRDNPDEATKDTPAELAAAPEAAAAQEPPQKSANEADAAPPQEATGETAETDPAVEPPLDLPRSWTKDQTEHWAKLDRATQEFLIEHDSKASAEVRRSQNEAAETRRVSETERARAEQARLQYEQALPALLQTMQEQQQGEFSDIKTMADVEKLAREDWPRYALWDAQQKKVAVVAQEVKAAQDRQQNEYRSKWSEYATKEDQIAADKIPELADKSKAAKFSDGAISLLKDIGFSERELTQAWNGEASLSLRDHRTQLLLADAYRYREAKAAVAKPAPKPVPPVQRPGVSKAPVNANDAELQTLEKRFERSGSLKDAAALRLARVRASA